MKPLKLFILLLLTVISTNVSFGQSKKELMQERDNFKNKITVLQDSVNMLKLTVIDLLNQIEEIKGIVNAYPKTNNDNDLVESQSDNQQNTGNQNNINTHQCKAITKAGTRCSRNAEAGSDYCWQHKNSNVQSKKVDSYSSDKIYYTGPRGGQYYINSKGKKVYP